MLLNDILKILCFLKCVSNPWKNLYCGLQDLSAIAGHMKTDPRLGSFLMDPSIKK